MEVPLTLHVGGKHFTAAVWLFVAYSLLRAREERRMAVFSESFKITKFFWFQLVLISSKEPYLTATCL